MRLKSFNVLEHHIKRNANTWKKLLDTDYLPSIDTIPRRIRKSDIQGLRHMNMKFIHKLHRNKALNIDIASNGFLVVGIDAHETFCSRKRCCRECKKRRRKVNGKWVYEYFHSYVIAQIVLCSIPVIIDIEPINPGEGELTAAKRLIKRILKEQGRMVDVFTFDALYLDSKLLNMLEKKNKYWIAVLKNKNREAYQEVDRLLPETKSVKTEINKRDVTLYDMHDLVGWDNLEKTFRAVVSDEEWYEWVLNPDREKVRVKKSSHWRWLTNMPSVYKAEIVHKLGHGRWNEEDRGFNDLANNINFDHPYHHHPVALMAMLWIISISFNLSYSFYLRNLKPEYRKAKIQNRSQLALSIIETFNQLTETIFTIPPLLAQPP